MPSVANSPLNIVLLGAGHVAGHLAPALVAAGHRIVGVWSRTALHAAELARQLPSDAAVLLTAADAATLHPDLVLVSVPDAAVAGVIAAAHLPADLPVAHTAGSLPLPAHPRAGVFYPLQTFSKGRPLDLGEVPFFLEATDPATGALLETLARALSRRPPLWLTAAERAPLHLAAVFAANFTNHLLGVSARVLAATANGPSLEVLHPLVQEVVAKAFAAPDGPFRVQTGPAVRHDAATLTAHRERLAADANLRPWLPVYDALTAAIQQVSPAAAVPTASDA